MKITIDIPKHQIAAFRTLGQLTGINWREALIQEINHTEFLANHPREIASAAMGYCRDDEHAATVLNRALPLMGNDEESRSALWLEYEGRSGKISQKEHSDLVQERAEMRTKSMREDDIKKWWRDAGEDAAANGGIYHWNPQTA